jgi:accessory gene regulator B
MNHLANKLAVAIKRTDPDRTHSVEVMQYSLTILLNTSFIFMVSFLIGWLTGELAATFFSLCTMMVLRMVSGGLHIRSAWGCNAVSIAICAGIPQLPTLAETVIGILNLLSLVIMILLSPRPDRNTRMPREWHPYLKFMSVLLAILIGLVGSQVMGLVLFAQSLTILPWRKDGKT